MGCVEARCHVTDFRRRSELKQFVATPPPKSPSDQRSRKVYALDCEMLYAAWGPAVARITLVDFRGDVVFDVCHIIRLVHSFVVLRLIAFRRTFALMIR